MSRDRLLDSRRDVNAEIALFDVSRHRKSISFHHHQKVKHHFIIIKRSNTGNPNASGNIEQNYSLPVTPFLYQTIRHGET
jgi:hypothetical protein